MALIRYLCASPPEALNDNDDIEFSAEPRGSVGRGAGKLATTRAAKGRATPATVMM